MKIPYGRSNFADIRRGGFFYVDKTPFLPVLESGESGYAYLLFLRPRRFGKSLFVVFVGAQKVLFRPWPEPPPAPAPRAAKRAASPRREPPSKPRKTARRTARR